MLSHRNAYFIPVWIVVGFISILVHELGHAFAMRYYGSNARIVLYLMGGLAIPEASWNVRAEKRTSNSQIIISAAGPIAGFLLAAIVIGAIVLSGGKMYFPFDSIFFWHFDLAIDRVKPAIGVPSNTEFLYELVGISLFVNILWGILNLMPVYPLDGGQIALELFSKSDSLDGRRKGLMFSAIVGGILAVVGLVVLKTMFMGIFFGIMAYQSWQLAQMMGGGGFGGYGGGRPW